jgi:hypothetical protein
VTIAASSLPLILWRELSVGEPDWWWGATAIVLLALFASSLSVKTLKPLRGYLVVILLIFFMGFGGGWRSGLVPLIRGSGFWVENIEGAPWAVNALATHLLRLSIPFAILGYLLLRGKRPRDFFLVKGNPKAPAEPSRLIGLKKPEPWTRVGFVFAAIFTLGTATFVILSAHPSLQDLSNVVPLLPAVIAIAVMNGFNEEFTLRAAPLSELVSTVGREQALMMTTYFFGIGHFYGVPPGLIGVALAGFLGWFLGKSIIETHGFTWAWLIHFIQDILVFTFVALAAA